MKERDHERKCMALFTTYLPTANLWKINDTVTGGQPDLEIAWNGHTTKIEFKVLKKDETVHDKWEDQRQLITCVRYEQQTQRCWVVAFRNLDRRTDRDAETLIYRPTKLLNRALPTTDGFDDDNGKKYSVLWQRGVIRLQGINYLGVLNLIRNTHL